MSQQEGKTNKKEKKERKKRVRPPPPTPTEKELKKAARLTVDTGVEETEKVINGLVDFAFKTVGPLQPGSKCNWGPHAATCSLLLNPDFHRCAEDVKDEDRPRWTPGFFLLLFEAPEHLLQADHPIWDDHAQKNWHPVSDFQNPRDFPAALDLAAWILTNICSAGRGAPTLDKLKNYDPFRSYMFLILIQTKRGGILPIVRECLFRRADDETPEMDFLSWLYKDASKESEWLFHPPAHSVVQSADLPTKETKMQWMPVTLPRWRPLRTPRYTPLIPCRRCGLMFGIDNENDRHSQTSDPDSALACVSTPESIKIAATMRTRLSRSDCPAIRVDPTGELAPINPTAWNWKKIQFDNLCREHDWVQKRREWMYWRQEEKKSKPKPVRKKRTKKVAEGEEEEATSSKQLPSQS